MKYLRKRNTNEQQYINHDDLSSKIISNGIRNMKNIYILKTRHKKELKLK